MTKEENILRFDSEQAKLILFICATDLSSYDDEVLVLFTEAIEGVIDYLFIDNELLKLTAILGIDNYIIKQMETLRIMVMKLYSPQWSRKLKMNTPEWKNIQFFARSILENLNFKYEEPALYMATHLEIDW